MGEEHIDVEGLFRDLRTDIFDAVEDALDEAPKGYTWTAERSIFKVTKIDDDAYGVELAGDAKIANRREAAAFILLLMAQGMGDADG